GWRLGDGRAASRGTTRGAREARGGARGCSGLGNSGHPRPGGGASRGGQRTRRGRACVGGGRGAGARRPPGGDRLRAVRRGPGEPGTASGWFGWRL
ncbi:MAG: hypothetical protein AVDCRST_MAG78-1995, partial [uncultured Rubrobacteraceae bacterium]